MQDFHIGQLVMVLPKCRSIFPSEDAYWTGTVFNTVTDNGNRLALVVFFGGDEAWYAQDRLRPVES